MMDCSSQQPQNCVNEIDTTSMMMNDSFIVVYDMVTSKNIYERIYDLGDFKICDNGDTLFYIPDHNNVSWVTSEEWHSEWKKLYAVILEEIEWRRVE